MKIIFKTLWTFCSPFTYCSIRSPFSGHCLVTILLLLTCSLVSAQTPSTERFIEVTGEGEVKVDPNIIYLSIELREYKKDGKIVKLEVLEEQLTKALQAVGIPVENLKVYASSGRQYDLRKTNSNLMIGKRYNLKITDLELLNPFLSKLAEVDILAVSVTEATHSDIEKFKTETKVKAISNAKEKAALLTSSLEAKLGQVLQIRETELVNSYPVDALQGRVSGITVRGGASTDYGYYNKGQMNTIDFEQIKLSYKIVVKFRIE